MKSQYSNLAAIGAVCLVLPLSGLNAETAQFHLIRTSDGAGADANIGFGPGSMAGGESDVRVQEANPFWFSTGFLLRFDLRNRLESQAISAAQIRLSARQSALFPGVVREIEVWGVRDEQPSQAFEESGPIPWATEDCNPTKAVFLGVLSWTDDVSPPLNQDDGVTFTSEALADWLRSDTDGIVTLLFRNRFGIPNAFVIFDSKETATGAQVPGLLVSTVPDHIHPADEGIVDVTQPPFNAIPNDNGDDTAAIQAALELYPNGGAIVYLPKGTYLISNELRWPEGPQGWKWKRVTLMGENAVETVIRLRDSAPVFQNAAEPRAMVWTGPIGSVRGLPEQPEERFGNQILNLTLNTGRSNPGAVGLQFAANNYGTVRDVLIRSEDGASAIGLDLGHVPRNGPLLVKNVVVDGFDIGVNTAFGIQSQTFEFLKLVNQRLFGWLDSGQCVSARGVEADGRVPAFVQTGGSGGLGQATLLDVRARGRGAASQNAAVRIESKAYIRNLQVTGYARAMEARETAFPPLPAPEGLSVNEYSSTPSKPLFPDSPTSGLNLPVLETPSTPWDGVSQWASARSFGAIASDFIDDTTALQAWVDSGLPTGYCDNRAAFPYPEIRSGYTLQSPLILRGAMRLFRGMYFAVLKGEPFFVPVDVRVENGSAPVVFLQGLSLSNLTINTGRTVVIRNCEIGSIDRTQPGNLFLEDVVTGQLRVRNGQKVWARQLDAEPGSKPIDKPHIENRGGDLWIFGLKTEGGGTIVRNYDGGRTEILGAHILTTSSTIANATRPMFINEGGALAVTAAESNFLSDNDYQVYFREVRGNVVRDVTRADLDLTYHYGSGRALPLQVSVIPSLIRLDELVASNGEGQIDYTGSEMPTYGGLRLTSVGRIFSNGVATGTVWRIRNSSTFSRSVVIASVNSAFYRALDVPPRRDFFVVSGVAAGAATHRLFFNGQQVAVKAASNAVYSDSRLVPRP